ncbi:uncharacterized protein [Henckelia pumila]|uniref:uncharacterized protein n=1 Tax=Henckelia pumila TaxID=405737 RepID=UPI003C6DD5D6
MVGSMKFDIEKFTGKNYFSLLRIKMRAILIQQVLVEEHKKKEETSDEIKNKDEFLEKAHSAIILYLGDRPLQEVAREESVADVWLKLENIYMMKSLANRLYMKQRLYSFVIKDDKNLVGHMRRDFPERKGKQQEKPKEDGTMVVASDGYDSGEVFVLEESDQGMVLLGNNQSCRIKGSGNIIIRMHDGIDRVITNVRLSEGTSYMYYKKLMVEADKFVKLCKEKDITRQRTMAGTPQQNGLKERMNITLLERVPIQCNWFQDKNGKVEWNTCKLFKLEDGKDSQINENLKIPFEAESSVPDTGSDEMEDENMTASNPKEDLSTYNLAKDRIRREIRAPKRFSEADLASYALTVAEEVELVDRSY